MRQLNFPKDAALKLGSAFVSDHNRSPLSISYERIENTVRTQRGFLRRYFVADKRTVSCSWTNLPENDDHTVDAGMGAEELEQFYLANSGAFEATITYDMDVSGGSPVPVTETLTVVFNNFSKTLASRKGEVNFYNVQISLEEV